MAFIRAILDQSLDSGCGAKITPLASRIAQGFSNHLVLIDFTGILRIFNLKRPKRPLGKAVRKAWACRG
jgi:hypothetical protein